MSAPLLEVRSLRVEFDAGRGLIRRRRFTAVDDMSFVLGAGETLGVVGESGSGKSTLARALLRLVPAAAGEVRWRGENLLDLGRRALRERRRALQMVFQDPLASLDPRMTVGEILAEPLRIFEPRVRRQQRRERTDRMLRRVGLPRWTSNHYPHEFSGGQCQRIGIARAMMSAPELLICDEAVSSLDVSIQGQIVNLLTDLQAESGMAMLFISHNLAVVRHISHRVLVMYRGRLVETAPREALFAGPLHPYTRALLAAVPGAAAVRAAAGPAAEPAIGEVPADAQAPAAAQPGCAYRPRCVHAVQVCAERRPLAEAAAPGHLVACHRHAVLGYSATVNPSATPEKPSVTP
ncbi:MAG TPA: oligopeptide/dipeptide ABC transporter ATP-binding protein [Steroidobacteraceae bacterium]|nr:oligopeptide/dipeptide ABC transporter ATP-binding protein [Steroidobacteraceae bacterium]